MAAVNPELADRSDLTDHERVKALFGSSPRVLLRAVGEFLKKEPGTLDHHNLRIIAAAAPHMGDPQLVAQLIDRLPITKMHIAAKPLDIESASETFAKVLPNYSNKSRRALVADLVRETTIHVTTFAPPERVPPEARKVVEGHLLELLRGDRRDHTRALESPFVTSRVVDAALDRIEQQINRSAAGSTNRPPSRLPQDVISNRVQAIFRSDSDEITPEHVARAWNLVERCEPDADTFRLIRDACSSPKVDAATAESIFETIRQHDQDGRLAAELLSNPQTPEVLARRIVKSVDVRFDLGTADYRLGVVRSEYYGTRPARQPSQLASRLHSLLQRQAAEEPELLDPMSSDELDLRVASLPSKSLKTYVVDTMRNQDALRLLASRARELRETTALTILRNPNTPRDVSMIELYEDPHSWKLQLVMAGQFPKLNQWQHWLVLLGNLTDEDLARIVRSIPDADTRGAVLGAAVQNPSAGMQLLECAVENTRSDEVLDVFATFAMSTTSPRVQLELSRIAERLHRGDLHDGEVGESATRGRKIGETLTKNGTLRSTVAEELATWMQNEGPTSIRVRSHGRNEVLVSYDELDVAQLAVDGVVTPDRVDALVASAVEGELSSRKKAAVRLLADAGLLTEAHWQQLTGHVDDHVALDFATHPQTPAGGVGITTLAEKKLADTETALAAGNPLPDNTQPTKWSELPGLLDVPFPETPAAKLIDGQVVSGRKLVVLKTARDLQKQADDLGNCLAGYENNVRDGTSFVATTQDDPDTRIAVSWDTDPSDGRNTRVREMNTRFNRGNVPDEFAAGVRAMTDELRAGTLQPVENVQPEVVTELPEKEAGDRQSMNIRVPRGRRPLHLHAAQPDNAHQRAMPAPHVLAARGEVEHAVDAEPNTIDGVADHSHTDGPATPELEL